MNILLENVRAVDLTVTLISVLGLSDVKLVKNRDCSVKVNVQREEAFTLHLCFYI